MGPARFLYLGCIALCFYFASNLNPLTATYFLPVEEQGVSPETQHAIQKIMNYERMEFSLSWLSQYCGLSMHITPVVFEPLKATLLPYEEEALLFFRFLKQNSAVHSVFQWQGQLYERRVILEAIAAKLAQGLDGLHGNFAGELPQIRFFPPSLWCLKGLVSLDLCRNDLIHFPMGILNLENLKFLYLDGNQIQEIPEEIGMLVRLESMWLSNNQLVQLPYTLGYLKSLVTLLLGGNPLVEYPRSLGRLPHLKKTLLELSPGAMSLPDLGEPDAVDED